MNQDRQLLHDYRFRFPGDPDACDGWGYNFDYAECSTSQPTPREHFCTLYCIVNQTNDPIQDFRNFIKTFNSRHRRKIKIVIQKRDQEDNDDDDMPKSRKRITLKEAGVELLQGDIHASGEVEDADPNVGFYARFVSRTESAWKLCQTIKAASNHGYTGIIEHTQSEFDIGRDLKLVTTSGLGPGDDVADGIGDEDSLATRFEIKNNEGTVVARCHVSYCDGSWDPSIGPTIESMAVYRDFRNQKILPLLWYWVKVFCEENWTLECMNNMTSPGNIMIKATQLTNAVCDVKDGELIWDKEFFYNYAGFGVRQLLGIMAAMIQGGPRGGRPEDEEAVLFTKLKSRQELSARREYTGADNIDWKEHLGPRSCDYCDAKAIKLLRCARCQHAFYCNATCQKSDWKGRHKFICKKTKEEFEETLIKRGLLERRSDGGIIMNHF